MGAAIRFECNIVEAADLDPVAKVLPADVGVKNWRPGAGQRIHAVFVLQHVACIGTVLAATARNEAVVATVAPSVLVEQLNQLALPVRPIDRRLPIGKAAGIADAFLVDMKRRRNPFAHVPKFRIGRWALIAHDAAAAEVDLPGQAVIGRQLARIEVIQ